ncbi:hypothetical protein O5D80_003424 [Batrachochytrium dendrobatidis]|nr:hypothetical protein O5D80_003424 [Batrachochytrium dendrobatidis]
MALKSWLLNRPAEVIFITIPKALAALEALAHEVDPEGRHVRVITVKKGNKRNQMVAGINQVRTEIIVFCDDDVVWPETMLDYLLAPFEDRQMGGVGTSQTVITKNKRMTIWEILAAYRITMRNIEVTSSTYIDGGVCCLSGRTATYRTAILRDPDFQKEFTNEFWRGKYHQHSGDDKFLTRWMHSHSWKTFIQACPEAELASTFKDNWHFLKQLLRWTRNTWRSDIRSVIFERYVWTRHPFVAFSMVDKFFNPITLIAGPVTVAFLATRPDTTIPPWAIVVSYIVWLLVTRLIKYMPHFIRRPQDVLAIPVWLVFNMAFMFMKVYCLFTLYVTDWGTRAGADHKKPETEEEIAKLAAEKDISEIYIPYWSMDLDEWPYYPRTWVGTEHPRYKSRNVLEPFEGEEPDKPAEQYNVSRSTAFESGQTLSLADVQDIIVPAPQSQIDGTQPLDSTASTQQEAVIPIPSHMLSPPTLTNPSDFATSRSGAYDIESRGEQSQVAAGQPYVVVQGSKNLKSTEANTDARV